MCSAINVPESFVDVFTVCPRRGPSIRFKSQGKREEITTISQWSHFLKSPLSCPRNYSVADLNTYRGPQVTGSRQSLPTVDQLQRCGSRWKSIYPLIAEVLYVLLGTDGNCKAMGAILGRLCYS